MLSIACGVFGNGVGIGYGGPWASQWLGINAALVLSVIAIASTLYALSSFIGAQKREKLRGIVRYEIFEAFVSIILIFIIMLLSGMMCYVGSSLSGIGGGFSGTFFYDNQYLGGLLFTKGAELISDLYTSAVEFGVAAQIASYIYANIMALIATFVPYVGTIVPRFGVDFMQLYLSYAALFSGTFGGIVLAVFGVILITFLMLPVIQAGSLTIVLPVAILMRTLAFTGPRLREASNMFVAIAIGLFFVFPISIAFDSYIASCLSIGPLGSSSPSSCSSWITPAELSYVAPPSYTISTSPLFSSQTATVFGQNVPGSFWSALSTVGAAPGILNIMSVIIKAPSIALTYSSTIADYAFEGIVLIGIDFLVTLGFISGLTKGLNAISGIISSGPIW